MAAFTTIAAATALATTAATTAKSFAQASKQKKLQAKAEEEADKAMADARKKIDVNYLEGLSIQKEPYELEREALLMSGAQALQAGVEGDVRGAAATAGRVQAAQQQGQRQIATAMGQEMAGLERAAASEDARIASRLASLDLGEAQGAQLAARDAQEARQAAQQQAMQGIQSFAQQASKFAPLYEKSNTAEQVAANKFQTDMLAEQTFGGGSTPNVGTYADGFFDPQLLAQFQLNQPFGGVRLSDRELAERQSNF